MMLSATSFGAIVLSLLAASQVEIHREQVREANESFLWIVGFFAMMGSIFGYMFWCEKNAEKRVKKWTQREGFELLEFYSNHRSWDFFCLYMCGQIKVKDGNGVMRTGSFSCAGGAVALLSRAISVKWH